MAEKKLNLPELLCPAGSMEALAAAVDAGADAVYFGGTVFNARMFANNFDADTMRRAVELCHTYGVRAYVTLNTLPFDREMTEFLRGAQTAYEAGADALIVADLGGAAAIRRVMPEMELHASTQASGHNADAGQMFARMGFSRMVCARELSLGDLRAYVAASPIESEVFIHGALCVCHSGQCLFSSMVGGRSGNRGACAQPCRLPYEKGKGKCAYPLSLKDLCLGEHTTELIEAGVSSLKIEGRMKSPEYVHAVTSVWRRLLDERRNATPEEMAYLAAIFSRGGFTDRYFVCADRTRPGALGAEMLGVRSEGDKSRSRELPKWTDSEQVKNRKLPLTLCARFCRGEPAELTLTDNSGNTGTARGAVPEPAQKVALTRESVAQSLGKLGGTPFTVGKWEIEVDEGLMLPTSALNALRREAVGALMAGMAGKRQVRPAILPYRPQKPEKAVLAAGHVERSARFTSPAQVTALAAGYFERMYLPLFAYDGSVGGVLMPSVIPDSERGAVERQLERAVAMGAKYLMIGNVGHLPLAQAVGLPIYGDFRLNVTNSETSRLLFGMGFQELMFSPELTLPQMRDMDGALSAIVYGRIPLMVVEKCVLRTVADCRVCEQGRGLLTDRTGAEFPVMREYPHRNIIYNSQPTYMADREQDLAAAGLSRRHFIFSDESPRRVDEIIRAYQAHTEPAFAVRRLGKSR